MLLQAWDRAYDLGRRHAAKLALLWVFSQLGTLCAHSTAADCDVQRTKTARDVIHAYVEPLMAKEGLSVPTQCFFHHDNDMLLQHEHNKHALSRGAWRCGYCGKMFKSEAYLDRHLHNTHLDQLPEDSSHCLAHYCDMLHCSHFAALWAGELPWNDDPLPCRQQQVLQQRQQCKDLAAQCFPPTSNTHEWFVKHMCEALTCDKKQQRYLLRQAAKSKSRGKRGRTLVAAVVAGVLLLLALLAVLGLGIWVSGAYGPGRGGKQA